MKSVSFKAQRRQQAALALAWAAALVVSGCVGRADQTRNRPNTISPPVVVRDVRVLLASGSDATRVRINGAFVIVDASGTVVAHDHTSEWLLVQTADGVRVGKRSISGQEATLKPAPGGTFELSKRTEKGWSPARRYPGFLTIRRQRSGKLQAVNYVNLDTYVAGVLNRELYPDFHQEAYRAQAVAARTYALYIMAQRGRRAFDVTATESSQVYGGLAEGRSASKAVEAAQHTRGIICTWTAPQGERIFCTYYSSACGGKSQDVADCKPRPSIKPLSGGVVCNYCKIAKGNVYRWGPVTIEKAKIRSRLIARYSNLKSMSTIKSIEETSRTRHGRPGRIRISDVNGLSHELRAEDFRLTVGSRIMRSTDCRLTDNGSTITLSKGQGFGHGMGLCQWGTQGQALQGRSAAEILKFYYPGMHLTRAY